MREWIPMLEHLIQDTRYALRGLRRSPGFTATVVVTLALGIGANAVMFNVVDRLMFRPLAYLRDPGSVHRLYWQWRDQGEVRTRQSGPYTRYLDIARAAASFSDVAAFSERQLAVGIGAMSREQRVATVSASYFGFFDARPVLGRFFAPDEDVTPRGADVAVLGQGYWQSAFGGRDVIGEHIRVGNIDATIIGVAPSGFAGVEDTHPPDLFVPITTYAASTGTDDSRTYYTGYSWGWMSVLVRLKPAVSVEQAERDATEAFRRSWGANVEDSPMLPALDVAQPQVHVGAVRTSAGPQPGLEARTALWLTAVAGIVLLIACANVANLVLARALQRERETALRLALGVRRGRLLMLGMLEGVVLALAGGAAAVIVAQWAGAALRALLLPATAPAYSLFADGRTLLVTASLAAGTGIVIGLVPALVRRRSDLARAFRGGSRSGMHDAGRLRATLLVAQAALSVVLLVGAALFVRSLDAVRSMRMGYDPINVVWLNRVIRGQAFDDSLQRATRQLLLSSAEALPEVEAAAWVSSAPFVSTSSTMLHVAGIDSVERLGEFTYQATTPGYFRVMGTRIVRGRGLTGEDRATSPPVAIVSESMARVLWPGQDAIGQCFRMRDITAPCVTVVGIAEDMVQQDIVEGDRYHYYVSIEQYSRTWGNGLLVKLRGAAGTSTERVRQALQRVMPGESYLVPTRLEDVLAGARRSWQLGATMFVAFGGLALVVAAVGLYGVIGYGVTQRMHELGVRIALGARRRDILALVTGQGMRLATLGAVLGIGVAVAASRWIEPLLFRQSATDPLIYVGVVLVLLLVAVAACLVPAVRASRADPNAALRAE
jgi:predicted permease